MTLALSILGLLSAVVPFGIWLWRRRIEEQDTPQEELKQYEDETRKAIAKGDAAAVTRILDDRMRRLDRNLVRPGGGAAQGGPDGSQGRVSGAGPADAGADGRAWQTRGGDAANPVKGNV